MQKLGLPKYKVVDLFAGCGGISRGLEMTGRFGTQFAAEIEPHPARAFEANITNVDGSPSRVYTGDVRDLASDSNLLWKELAEAGIYGPGEVDLLTGGPPCQGFSRNGVRKYADAERNERFYDEPRNLLYKAFLDILDEIQPKVVLIENVREFLKAADGRFLEDLLSRLGELGYEAEAHKVCAADYGVPQTRHRAVILASKSPIRVHYPEPTHAKDGGLLEPAYVTVREAIGDLPSPAPSQKTPPLRYMSRATDYSKQLRSSTDTVPNHVDRPLSELSLARVNAVGHKRMKDIDKGLQTKAFYGSAYGRLEWDKPSLTITTWVYHVGSGRFAHPVDDRGITMREAARLQSFDDRFTFPPLINPVSQMIGNAVPPLLAKAFGTEIAAALDSETEVQDSATERMLAVH